MKSKTFYQKKLDRIHNRIKCLEAEEKHLMRYVRKMELVKKQLSIARKHRDHSVIAIVNDEHSVECNKKLNHSLAFSSWKKVGEFLSNVHDTDPSESSPAFNHLHQFPNL